MSRIFISYAHKDHDFVNEISTSLERVYDNVWIDEEIPGGAKWEQEIHQKISECDIFIFMLSENAVSSVYCKKEFDEAIGMKKEILPVRITPTEQIPDFLTAIQYVDMIVTDRDGTKRAEITPNNLTNLHAAINRLSDKIAKELRQEQTRLLNLRRRSILLRWVVGGVALVGLAVIAILLLTQLPPFQGQIAYVARKGANLEINVIRGGLPGLFRNITRQNPRTIKIEDLFPADNTGFTWSLDGSKIAFVSSRRDANLEIYTMEADGSNLQRLTTNTVDDTDPSWSPDGLSIAFASNRDGNWEIYQMGADGQNPVNLTNNPADDETPTWSPQDARSIAFASNRPAGDRTDWDIYRVDVVTKSVLDLTQRLTDNNQDPSWSPDGKYVAFESSPVPQSQSDTQVDPLDAVGLDVPAASGPASCVTITHDIYYTDADGVELTWLVRNKNADDRYPSWSPDGQYIVYTSNRGENSDLYIIPVNSARNGQNELLLTRTDQEDNTFPAWHS